MKSKTVPLVVDLDGTLTNVDTLHESLIRLLLSNPISFFKLAPHIRAGRSQLKSAVASVASLDPKMLPYNEVVIKLIVQAKADGRKIVLASAANQQIVDSVSEHLGFFDLALGSSATRNLSGSAKAAKLDEEFGIGNYDYVGNSKADLQVWAKSKQALIVSGSKTLATKVAKLNESSVVIDDRKTNTVGDWVKQLRIHQWSKNILLAIPLLAAFSPLSPSSLLSLGLAFLSFGLVASSVYLLNDLSDLDNDRSHHIKRARPFAAGRIPIFLGLSASVGFLILGMFLATTVGAPFLLVMAVYFAATVLYTFALKRVTLVDSLVLAFLYTLRVIAGGIATATPVSFWLLSLSVFLFMSLAWVKRYAELDAGLKLGKDAAKGRGYTSQDMPIIMSLGVASGFLSILVFALYLDSKVVSINYRTPELAWLAVPMFTYLVGRVWIKAHRGEMNQDPLIYIFKDKASLLTAGLVLVALISAHIGVTI